MKIEFNADDNLPLDRDWLDQTGLGGETTLQGYMKLEAYGHSIAIVSEDRAEYYGHRSDLDLLHIKTRGQFRLLMAAIRPCWVDPTIKK